MSDVYVAGIILLLALAGWIWLVGWMLTNKRERRAITQNIWARADERSKIRTKVEALPLMFADDESGGLVILSDVLALLDE